MIYRLNASTVKRVYPVFTEVPPSSSQTLAVSKRANETTAAPYMTSAVDNSGGAYHSESATPVLYPTGTSDITYEWKEETTDAGSRSYLYWVPVSPYTNNQFCWFYTSDVDGSERALTADELAKLNITYNYDTESGDKESFGNAGENNDFLYNTGTSIITVHNYAANYKNGVYTLKATYVDNGENKYSDEFDIVFERTA